MKNFLTCVTVVILLSPNIIFCQTAPDLKTAASFVLFTGSGQFTSNSSSTMVTGNVGNEVGAVSAFPPGTLNGTANYGNGVAIQANLDITDAYADLFGRTCGTVHGVGFGSGETLTPDTYCATAASTLNGTLTLDAQNNPAAVFIIKINGAFSAATGSQVLLVNQASACNVYWQIGGAVDLNNTIFKGTMLVDGAITLNSGTTLDGRALTKTGALIFDDITATVCNFSVLPLKLANFDVAKTTGNNVQLSWLTTSEVNMLRYEIESSANGATFHKAGTVVAKGNNFPTQYTFKDLDANRTGTRFYRLKMVNNDASFSYSSIKSIKFSETEMGLITISPNPAVNTINIKVNAETTENITLSITNLNGQKITQRNLMLNKGINTITEDIHGLSKAGYILTIKSLNTGKQMRQNFQKL
ncbi:MAG TPA: ice-binding family protein [Chitinophagaceae bacterium]|nr:ice-binding family protein [Chitinophagaceae bacterium]